VLSRCHSFSSRSLLCSFLQVAMQLLRVAMFWLCFGEAPSYRLIWHLLHYHCSWEALHSRVLGITKFFKWKFVYVFGWPRVAFGYSLHNILSIRFLSSMLEWVTVMFLVTLLSSFLEVINVCGEFGKGISSLCLQKTTL
jgi:hypothetical protein